MSVSVLFVSFRNYRFDPCLGGLNGFGAASAFRDEHPARACVALDHQGQGVALERAGMHV